MKKRHGKQAWSVWAVLFVVALGGMIVWQARAQEATGAESRTQSAMTIGTFNTRAVALAWGRSKEFLDWSARLYEQGNEAKAAGDEKRIAELTTQGEGQQERLHAQVFGNAPIDDVLQRIEGDLPNLARKTGVDAIAGQVAYHAPSVRVVEVTDAMVALFDPTDETLKMIKDLTKSPPVALKIEH